MNEVADGYWMPLHCPYALHQRHGYLHIHDARCEPLVVKDDAYWAELRASLGKGTRSSLWGTSRRSLDKAVQRARDSYGEHP